MPKTGYGNLKVTIPVEADEPIDLEAFFKQYSDSFGSEQGKGKLLVVQNTGAAAWEAMKGDATLAEDGTLKLAKPVVNGTVSAAGAKVLGSGFATERLSTGLYRVILTAALPGAGNLTGNLVGAGSAGSVTFVEGSATQTFTVETRNQASAVQDVSFTFAIKQA